MKYKYKVEYFSVGEFIGCCFAKDLRDLINEYAEKGWMFHSFEISGHSSNKECVAVFYKEAEETE